MSIATEFELTFGCGHVGTVDLSALTANRRAGRLRYLEDKGLCGECFDAARRRRRNGRQTNWVTVRRGEENAQAVRWARDHQFPPLIGSRRQVALASRIRVDLMRGLQVWAVRNGRDPAEYWRVQRTAKRIRAAVWRLDHGALAGRQPGDDDADPIGDLVALLDAAARPRDGLRHGGRS